MWKKFFRLIVFVSLYQILVEAYNFNNLDQVDSIFGDDFKNQDLETNSKELSEVIAFFNKNRDNFTNLLQNHTQEWDKTYPITKSILFTALSEFTILNSQNVDFDVKNFINKYLKLSQNYIDDDNAKLVHAILAKVLV